MSEIILHDPNQILAHARQAAESKFFSDSKEAAQAFVKISAGLELGFGPFQSMTGIHIIKGKPSVSASLMASAVKASSKYDYRIKQHTDMVCEIEFYQDGQALQPTSKYTVDDARKAGLMSNPVWKNHPKNMLFARAMSNGVKWHCPDVFGTAVYTPDELGAPVNEDGDIIDVQATVNEPKPEPTPPPSPGTNWSDNKVFMAACFDAVGGDTEENRRLLTNAAKDKGYAKVGDITDERERSQFVDDLKGNSNG